MRSLPRWLPVILVVAPLAWLLPLTIHPADVAFQPGSQFTDLAVTHWPNALFIHQALREWHTLPLWNPYSLAGTPFAANPLSGLWYPPLWLAALFPVPLAFNLLLALHLAWAGLGAYFLAREEGLGQLAALAAGLVIGGLPKLIAHVAAGHVSLVMAIAWTGWLLALTGRAADRRRVRDTAAAGMILGLIILIDPRWALPAALMAAAYGLRRGGRSLITWRGLALVALGAIFAAGLSAGLTLPLMEYAGLSSRGGLLAEETLALSLPPVCLLGFFIPQPGSNAEVTVYVGLVVFALAVVGLAARHGRSFWACTFIFAVLAALGGHTPLYPALVRILPGLSLLRVPARFMLVAGFALAMLAARGVEMLLEHGERYERRQLRLLAAALTAAGAVGLGLQLTLHLPAMLLRTSIMTALVGAILALRSAPRLGRAWLAAAALAAVAFDLALYDATLIEARPAEQVTAHGESAAREVARDETLFRVYSPSYSVPQPAAILNGLQLADGVDPLQLSSTVERVLRAGGLRAQGYSVTLPPFATGDPAHDNLAARPSAELLGQLNVAYVVAEFPLQAEGLRAIGRADQAYIYYNERAQPRAWVAASLETWDASVEGHAAHVVRYTANTIEVSAEGPGLLVLSEASYPGWRTMVDGQSVDLLTAGGWFRAVELGPGAHEVRLSFVPASLIAGALASLLTLIAFIGVRRWDA